MSNSRFFRLSAVVATLVITSLVTACSDTTGPSARRSGYITTATAVQAINPGAVTQPGQPLPTKPTLTTKSDSGHTTNSGYNVTAF